MHILAISPGTAYGTRPWTEVLRSGVDGLLVREYAMGAGALLETVRRCQDLAPGLEIWVAGRLDIALRAGCGLHAPEDYPDCRTTALALSRPLHAEAQWAERQAAAQLLISPVHPGPGKGAPWGLPRLHAFLDGLPPEGPRLLALGGIGAGNAAALRHPRLAGVAVIRAIWEAPEPARAVEALRQAWA